MILWGYPKQSKYPIKKLDSSAGTIFKHETIHTPELWAVHSIDTLKTHGININFQLSNYLDWWKLLEKRGTMFSMFETNTQVETTQLLFTSFVWWTFGGAQPDSAARWWKSWCKRVLISMSKMRWKSWPLATSTPEIPFFLLSQWLNKLELLGITYLVGKIKFKLFFQGPLAEWVLCPPKLGRDFEVIFEKLLILLRESVFSFQKFLGWGKKQKTTLKQLIKSCWILMFFVFLGKIRRGYV